MSLPDIFGSMNAMLQEMQVNEVLRVNDESEKYGLTLTAEEAKEIIEARNQVLQNYGRIELDIEATRKLIRHFCASPFISQEDYLLTLKELQEIFYYLKNETEDDMGDDELLAVIKDYFDNSCGGSMELLKGNGLEIIVKEFRRNNQTAEDLWEGEKY